MLSEFHFLRPWWLLAFVPLLLFLVGFARRHFEQRRWQRIVDPALMPYVLIGSGQHTRRRITTAAALGGLLLITALAGPVWQRMPQPVFRNLDALVIAVDLSRSMDVADVKPSRLSRARFKISDILERRNEGQTALIVYAADAYVISPLTDDTDTITAQLPALTTSLMPSQGSRADRALQTASELLRQAGAQRGEILLVTDGVDAEQTTPVAEQLAARGIHISVLGVGTDAGGPIPGPGGFIKQTDGSIVIARVDSASLEAVARHGGGQFRQLSASDRDIENLLSGMSWQPEATEDTGLKTDVWREEGPWLLLPLLALAALAFRRGVLAAWLLVCFMPIHPAKAMTAEDLWARPDQRASRMLADGDAAGAAGVFADPGWKAAAAYQAGNYAESLAALEGLDDIEATYNRGNALAKLNRYEDAIAAYEDVLARDAEHRDARYNLDLLKKLQQQQQQDKDNEAADNSGNAGDSSQEPGENPDGSNAAAGDANDGSEPTSGEQSSGQQQSPAQADNGGEHSGRPNNDPATDGPATENPADSSGPGESGTEQNADQPGDAQTKAQSDQHPPADAENESDASQETGVNATATGSTAAEGDAANPAQGSMTRSGDAQLDEAAQATEQWLRKIPDDPGGLLRRKFYYQYQQQPAGREEDEPW